MPGNRIRLEAVFEKVLSTGMVDLMTSDSHNHQSFSQSMVACLPSLLSRLSLPQFDMQETVWAQIILKVGAAIIPILKPMRMSSTSRDAGMLWQVASIRFSLFRWKGISWMDWVDALSSGAQQRKELLLKLTQQY